MLDAGPQLPFFSGSDLTTAGIVSCTRVDGPPPGEAYRGWATLWHLYRLIDAWPW